MNNTIKAPWYRYYTNMQKHLNYPDISLYSFLEKSSQKHLNNISYNYFGNKKTYKDFIEQIDSCAKSFKKLGIKSNDVISICMPNTPEAIISFYAINKIGAIANMIHPLSAENEIKHFVNVSNSKLIITIDIAFNKINHIISDTKLKKVIIVSASDSMPIYLKVSYLLTQGRKVKLEHQKNAIKWSNFIKLGIDYKGETYTKTQGKDTAAILYSGGTTGYPKGIELTNLNFNALAMQGVEACSCIESGDTVLAIMPVFHGFGLGICIHTSQYLGATSILLPKFSAKTFDKLLKKYKPNIIAGVPTLYEALLKNKNLQNYDLSFLKCVISGGDSLSISLKEKIDTFLKEHNANVQIREGYGLTECVTGSCLTPLNYHKKGSVGIPYPDTYYKIVKPNTSEELPYGEYGEIVISGPTVMKGYLNDVKETNLTLKKHADGLIWMHTGDLGSMDEDGFIYFKQRIKRIIVSSGYSIYPQYIENIIDSHKDVLMSCVIGIDHSYKIQVAKAFIVLKDPKLKNEETLNSIKEYCQKNLAKYSWPYEYEFRDELPQTLVGKVAYNELIKEEQKKNGKK
ncbi:MAG: AMP-binding protein [Clostridiaceae bacterium]|nr:AMP-binding protein [Clostridiaceae bacterium]